MKFVVISLSLFLVTGIPQRLGIRLNPSATPPSGTVLTDADITYVGAIRTPLTGYSTGNAVGSAYGGLGGRIFGDGHVHLFIWGNSSDSIAPHVIEMDINGITPQPVYTTPGNNAVMYQDWGDIAHGKRQSWSDNGCGTPDNTNYLDALPDSLYWNPATNLLYWTYNITYTGQAKWSMGASSLDSQTGPTTTAYGPWRFTATDKDNVTLEGSRAQVLFPAPDGSMLAGGAAKSGNVSLSFGFSAFGDNAWPTTATTGGCPSSAIAQTNRYLNYYFPPNIFEDGSFTPPIVQFQLANAHTPLTYINEVLGAAFTGTGRNITLDPAQNGGIGAWGDEINSMQGGWWFQGLHKQGVIFSGAIDASSGTSSADCTGATHNWYLNAGQYEITMTGVVGTFSVGETVTGGTSHNTMNPVLFSANSTLNGPAVSNFTIGETATGGTSGAHGVVSATYRSDVCRHGCACVQCASAGPSTTKSSGVIAIYDQAKLLAVKAGSANDYAQVADEIIDTETTYGIKLAVQQQLQAKALHGGWLDPNTNYLYLFANMGDDSFGISYVPGIVHVFAINDSAAPLPDPLLALFKGVFNTPDNVRQAKIEANRRKQIGR